jgi:hypothetical protein
MIFWVWVREIAGWMLIAAGVAGFYGAYWLFANTPHLLGGLALVVATCFVFRAGIHLLKIAVAARMGRLAQDRLYPAAGGPSASSLVRGAPRRRA